MSHNLNRLNRFLILAEPLLLFVFCLLLLLPSVWLETSITGQDEYWLSLRTPLEMDARKEWFTPWLNGEPRLAKPPLLYWCILLFYHFFGVTLISARIWGVLAGCGLALTSYLLARELQKPSLLAGLITISSIGVVLQGRQAMLDLPVAFFSCLATYFTVLWWKRKSLSCALLAASSLSLGFLVKGPICLYFFAISAASALVIFRSRPSKGISWLHVSLAILLFLVVCLPWPLTMFYLHPNIVSVAIHEIGARNIGSVNLSTPLSALGGALGLIFPWTIVSVAAIIQAFRERDLQNNRIVWLATWYLASCIPFLFMKCFERYMLAILPPLSILCAHLLATATPKMRRHLLLSAAILTAVFGTVLCLFSLWFRLDVYHSLFGLVALGGVVICAFQVRTTATATMIAAAFSIIMGTVYPGIGINALPPSISSIVQEHPVAVFNSPQPSMLSMRLKRSVIALDANRAEGPSSMNNFNGLVFVTKENDRLFHEIAEKGKITVAYIGSFATFYSRKAWQRLARTDATREDWIGAFQQRDLENLKSEIFIYQLSHNATTFK